MVPLSKEEAFFYSTNPHFDEPNTSAGNILTLGPSPLMGEGWGEGE